MACSISCKLLTAASRMQSSSAWRAMSSSIPPTAWRTTITRPHSATGQPARRVRCKWRRCYETQSASIHSWLWLTCSWASYTQSEKISAKQSPLTKKPFRLIRVRTSHTIGWRRPTGLSEKNPAPTKKRRYTNNWLVKRRPTKNVRRSSSSSTRCAGTTRRVSALTGPSILPGRSGHQIHEHPSKPLIIEIHLNLNRLGWDCRFVFLGPCERVPVACAAIQVNAHVSRLAPGDQAGINPRGSCQLIPHVLAALSGSVVLGDVAAQWRPAIADLFDDCRGEPRLDRYVHRSAYNLPPGRAQHNPCGFWIEPEVEFMPGITNEFWIVGVRTETSAHENQFRGGFRKGRIERDRQGQVGHRCSLINRDLVGIAVHHSDHEVGRIFARRLRCRLTFGRRRDGERFMPPAVVPGASKAHLPIALLPELGFFAAAHQ